jgi:hypothetical protein
MSKATIMSVYAERINFEEILNFEDLTKELSLIKKGIIKSEHRKAKNNNKNEPRPQLIHLHIYHPTHHQPPHLHSPPQLSHIAQSNVPHQGQTHSLPFIHSE